jgi:hypothetical protein
MYDWSEIGDPLPCLDGFNLDETGADESSAVMVVGTADEHDLVRLAAWDDGLGLDVYLLLTPSQTRELRDRLGEALQRIEAF